MGNFCFYFYFSFAHEPLPPILGGFVCFLFHLLEGRSPPILWEIFVFVFHLKLLNECLPGF